MSSIDLEPYRRDVADKWAGELCTLQGEPARVVGRLDRFATVRTIRDSGPRAEYAWEIVDIIMSRRNGRFE